MICVVFTCLKHRGINQRACRAARLVAAYPLVDGVVLAVIKLLVKVEDPQGCAGVEVVVIEDAVNCYVLPRSHHHFLRDVAHLCQHTHCFGDNVNAN